VIAIQVRGHHPKENHMVDSPYIENQVQAIQAAHARGDTAGAAAIVAHYLLEGGLDRSQQEKFMDDLGDAARE